MYETKSPESKIRAATQAMLTRQRFFGALALAMTFEEGDTKTIAGDGLKLTFNRRWVENALHDEIKGCMGHIVMACSLHHMVRRGARDSRRWQMASRLATAPLLAANDLWVPPQITDRLARGYEDLPVEIIYDRLDDPDDPGRPQASPQDAQAPQGGGSSAGAPQDGDDGNDGQGGDDGPQDGETDPGGQGGQGDPQDGDGFPDVPGEIRDAPADVDQQELEQEWDRNVEQAYQSAKAAGSQPGGVEQVFRDKGRTRADWRDRLEQFMRASAPTDYSWRRPNRRFIADDLYLPSLHGIGMGPVVCLVDTSGSVDDAYVNRSISEVFRICQDLRPERIWIIQCDARVQSVEDFDPLAPPHEIRIRGRGGTHFRPAFAKIRELGLQPDVAIYFTDGLSSDRPPPRPAFPVIWAVETDAQAERIPFGAAVVVPKDE